MISASKMHIKMRFQSNIVCVQGFYIKTLHFGGALILYATCAPQQISYPQDVNLLNEARENLEGILDKI